MKRFFYVVSLFLCCGLANAADPFKLRTGWERSDQMIYIQSTENNVVITNIVLNRGNCQRHFLKMKGYAVDLPVRLNFGDLLMVTIGNCKLLEAKLETHPVVSDNGNTWYTFNWNN
jgi:hypothetical protein